MKTRTQQILGIMNVIAWIIFIALSIQTGAIAVSWFVSLHNPVAAKNLYMGLSFFNVRQYDIGHYSTVVAFVVTLSALKAFIAYLGVRIFSKLNFSKPFSAEIANAIEKISQVSFGAGLMALVANAYGQWLIEQGVALDYYWASEEFLLLGGIIFIVAQVFKRGIEIQAENDLTI